MLSSTCADFDISGVYSQRNVACLYTGLKKRVVGFNGDLVLSRSFGLPVEVVVDPYVLGYDSTGN
jgi:hypothetical protein